MPDLWDRQRLGPDGQFVDEGGELEPVLWYGRFEQYRLLGPTRNLRDVVNMWRETKGYKKGGSVPGSWSNASVKWRWRERAQAWDLSQIEARRQLWEDRAAQRREEDWEMATRLEEKARSMAAFPISRQTTTREVEGEMTQITVEPMDWRPSDVVRFAKAASELGRLATGMVTSRVGLELEDVLAALPREFRDAVCAALTGELSADDDTESTPGDD